MKNNKNLYLYTAVFIGAIVLSGCSTMTQNVDKRDPTPGFLETSYYRGDLIPGKVQTSLLISNDIWQFQGVKGRRVVIMDLVDKGNTPPEIYLYPPVGSDFEARTDVESGQYRVLDHELAMDGDYVILVRSDDPAHIGNYKIDYAAIPSGGTYSVDPDDPEGSIIQTSRIGLYQPRSGGIANHAIFFDMATFGFGPMLYGAFIGIGSAVQGIADLPQKLAAEKKVQDTCPPPVLYGDKELILCSTK